MIVEQKVREVLKLADRVYVLRNGRVSYSGTAGSLSDEAKLRQVTWEGIMTSRLPTSACPCNKSNYVEVERLGSMFLRIRCPACGSRYDAELEAEGGKVSIVGHLVNQKVVQAMSGDSILENLQRIEQMEANGEPLFPKRIVFYTQK